MLQLTQNKNIKNTHIMMEVEDQLYNLVDTERCVRQITHYDLSLNL